MYTEKEKQEEDRKVRKLQRLVDYTCCALYQPSLSPDEAFRLIGSVKKIALQLFPDKEQTFEMIYGSRFRRILSERFNIC